MRDCRAAEYRLLRSTAIWQTMETIISFKEEKHVHCTLAENMNHLILQDKVT